MHKMVPQSTKLAASSCPSPTISEKFNTTDAIGADESITNACFTVVSIGRAKTNNNMTKGMIICLTPIII